MIEIVLFEFEGVLADTAAIRRDALVQSLADEGVTISPDEYDDVCAGFPVHHGAITALAISGLDPDDTAAELITLRAERYFADGVGKGLALAPGAREFLDATAGRARLGIVTRAARREVDFVLSLAGLDGAFECVVTADDVGSAKPSPEPYERALERLARRRPARPGATLAMEDSPAGILSASAVRIPCIAVGAGIPMYHAVKADAYVPTLAGQSLESLGVLLARGAERGA